MDGATRFEIAVATSILFDGFVACDPRGGGLRIARAATTRLEAHAARCSSTKLCNLAEWLCWEESHVRPQPDFGASARRLFLHGKPSTHASS